MKWHIYRTDRPEGPIDIVESEKEAVQCALKAMGRKRVTANERAEQHINIVNGWKYAKKYGVCIYAYWEMEGENQ